MICTVETTGELTRKMTIKIPSTFVEGEVDSKLKEIRRSFSYPGFRQGHVPQRIIEKKFSSSVRDEVLHKALEKAVEEKITTESLDLASQLKIDEPATDDTGDVCFEATFDVFPDFDIKPFSEFEIEKSQVLIDDASVDKAFINLLRSQGDFEAADKKAEKDDFVKLSIEVTCDGQRTTHMDWNEGIIKVGETSQRFEGVLEAVEGLGKDDTKTIEQDKDGEKYEYLLKVLEVGALTMPEMTEEFFKKMNFEATTEAEAREEVKKQLLERAEYYRDEEMIGKVVELLLEAHDFAIPPSLNPAEGKDEGADEAAEDTLKKTILVRTLAKKLDIELNQDTMKRYYDKMAKNLGMQPDFFAMMAEYSEEYRREHQYQAMVSEIVDRFLKEATCIDKEVPLSDFVSIV